jgi:hypothetical protein
MRRMPTKKYKPEQIVSVRHDACRALLLYGNADETVFVPARDGQSESIVLTQSVWVDLPERQPRERHVIECKTSLYIDNDSSL